VAAAALRRWWNGFVQSNEPTIPDSFEESLLRAGFAQGAQYLETITTGLTASNARQRVLALRAGARQNVLSTENWSHAFSDADVEVRREALNLFAHQELHDTNLLEQILGLLSDGDALVVDGAVFALGEHLYIPSVEALCAIASSHDDARCRESAVAALGEIGDDRARSTILGALEDKPPVRRRAIVALSNFEGPDIDAALEKASEDRDWQVRAAVSQLGREEND
jgi:HEAT repeat protein